MGLVNLSAYLLMEGLNSCNSNGKISVPLSLQPRKLWILLISNCPPPFSYMKSNFCQQK